MIESLLGGLELLLTLQNFFWLIVGVLCGVIIGALPGLGPLMVIALLLPVSFYLPPISAIVMYMGIYKAGVFGGSISAILLNMPGTGGSTATTMDGYPLTQQGKSRKALEIGLYSSFFGDTFSDFLLLFLTPVLAGVSLQFGPAEYFVIVLFSLTIIGYVTGDSMSKGLIMASLGVFLSLIGMDPAIYAHKYTFGIFELRAGIPFIPLIIGLFVFSEIMIQYQKTLKKKEPSIVVKKDVENRGQEGLTFQEFKGCFPAILRSSFIGSAIGILPGLSASLGAWVSYYFAKRFSKTPEKFGKGALEGVAAAESGNNAVCGANLIPLLSLGIPGSPVAAVLLGSLVIYGIRPGPRIFIDHGTVLYAIILGIIFANFVNLFFGSLIIKYSSKFINLVLSKPGYLYPPIIALSIFGTYSINNRIFDIYTMLFFAVLGYLFRKFNYPLPALIIGFILGPLAEEGLRHALMISRGNLLIFLNKPIVVVFLLLTLLSIIYIIYNELTIAKKPKDLVSEERE